MNIPAIQVLLLGKNNLGEALHKYPGIFSKNHKLRSLDISNCNVRSYLSKELLSPLKMLTHLNLSSNPNLQRISGLQRNIFLITIS